MASFAETNLVRIQILTTWLDEARSSHLEWHVDEVLSRQLPANDPAFQYIRYLIQNCEHGIPGTDPLALQMSEFRSAQTAGSVLRVV